MCFVTCWFICLMLGSIISLYYQIKTNKMKNFKITFGTGTEELTVLENNCVSFAEAVIRLEYTGFDCTEITKIEVTE